ncbi:hypothetical protein RRF57_004745 [Xylaria bambusicola]|uniref:Uncharacterized protein n=1 Tax=Xylaria bambusicola TaxID=326684 RepID=A0AAN7YX96_9PEZI
MIPLWLTHQNEQALRVKPGEVESGPETSFKSSGSLCSSCVELLETPLGVQVLIRNSFRSLTRSCITCALCRIIRRGLLGATDGAIDVVDLQITPGCRLPELMDESTQTTQIWGLRQTSDHHMIAGSSSGLEVMMAKGHLKLTLTTAAKHGIRAPKAPWGLDAASPLRPESKVCPYTWAFQQRFGHASEWLNDIRPAPSSRTG